MAEPWEKDPVVGNTSGAEARWLKDPVVTKTSFSQNPTSFPKVKRSWREEQMAKQVVLSPEETAADEAHDRSPESFAALQKELKLATHPKAKEVLQAEFDRLAPFFKVIGK